jgi:hypothetical protein
MTCNSDSPIPDRVTCVSHCRATIFFPIAWSVFLFFFLPAVQVFSLGFRLVIFAVTILAIVFLVKSVSGWRYHIWTLPLWGVLMLLIYATWMYPIWTHKDYQRARQKTQQTQPQP